MFHGDVALPGCKRGPAYLAARAASHHPYRVQQLRGGSRQCGGVCESGTRSTTACRLAGFSCICPPGTIFLPPLLAPSFSFSLDKACILKSIDSDTLGIECRLGRENYGPTNAKSPLCCVACSPVQYVVLTDAPTWVESVWRQQAVASSICGNVELVQTDRQTLV